MAEGGGQDVELTQAFWHMYKPALYPLQFSEHDCDASFPSERSSSKLLSLVQLASLAVVQKINCKKLKEELEQEDSTSSKDENVIEKDEDSNSSAEDLISPNEETTRSICNIMSNGCGLSVTSTCQSSESSNLIGSNSCQPTATDQSLLNSEKGTLVVSHNPTMKRKATRTSTQYLLHKDLALPMGLCHALLSAALTLFKDEVVERLLSQWPHETLVLSRYVPAMFDSLNPLYSDLDLCMEMRRGVKYTTCLAHSFMVCIKRHDQSKLRILDMTGFPTAEITLSYLASHVLLVSNEERQRGIISLYNRLTADLSLSLQLRHNTTPTFPDSKYMVCLDGLLETESAHLELCRALHASTNNTSPLTLSVRRVDVSNLGVVRIIVLLELLKPEHVTAVSLRLNTFVNSALVVLLPALERFSSLSSLDLSSNVMSMLNPSSDSAQSLAAILSQLPSLKRLNLSNNILSGCLEKLLTGITQPLALLYLSSCSLLPADLQYLSHSHHAPCLEELALGHTPNLHSQSFTELLRIIHRSSQHLRVLDLNNTEITVRHLSAIFVDCYTLHELRYVDIGGSALPVINDIISLVPYLSAQRRLQSVRLPYPGDVTVGPLPQCCATLLADVRMAFQVLTKKLIKQLHDDPTRPPYRLVFV